MVCLTFPERLARAPRPHLRMSQRGQLRGAKFGPQRTFNHSSEVFRRAGFPYRLSIGGERVLQLVADGHFFLRLAVRSAAGSAPASPWLKPRLAISLA